MCFYYICVTHNELFFHVFTPHLSTCEWRCPWPSPAVWLGQSHQSLQPACCTGTDISTRHAAESLGDQICKGEQQVCWGQIRFSVSTAHSRRRLDLCFRCPSSYLILKGVAGSTLGFCFWGASSSFLFLFHPNHPLRGKWQVTIEKIERGKRKSEWETVRRRLQTQIFRLQMLSSTLTPDFGLETTPPLDEAFVFAACALMPCALIQASKNYPFVGSFYWSPKTLDGFWLSCV